MAIGHWSLAIGHWPSAIGHLPIARTAVALIARTVVALIGVPPLKLRAASHVLVALNARRAPGAWCVWARRAQGEEEYETGEEGEEAEGEDDNAGVVARASQ